MAVEDYEEYAAAGGYGLLQRDQRPAELLTSLVTAASQPDLCGRGGAGFPAAKKIAAVASQRTDGRPAAVVANGAEGEPLSIKDRYLLRFRPHLVLDGLLLVARALESPVAYLYAADRTALHSVTTAVAALGQRWDAAVALDVVVAQDTYVAGEETAAVRAIGTGVARPTDKPPRPFESGVRGMPTLVLNVETLAALATRVRRFGQARAGTFLVTVSGEAILPRLYELPLGLPLGELLNAVTVDPEDAGSILMGGFFGGILPVAPELQLDHHALRRAGSSLGCGALHLLSTETCPIAAAARVAGFLADNTAEQCGSCMSSTRAVAAALASAGEPHRERGLEGAFTRWSGQLRGRGACALPDGLAVLLASLLRHFPDQIDRHINDGCQQCSQSAGQKFQLRLQPPTPLLDDGNSEDDGNGEEVAS